MNSTIRTRAAPAAVLAAIGLTAAACGGTMSSSRPAGTTPASAAATATEATCAQQAYAWAHTGGGISDAHAIGTDTSKISVDDGQVVAALQAGTDTSAALSALTADASQLGADAQTALANQPPACIAGEAAPYRAAMAEYSQSSQDDLSLATEIQSGNDAAAIETLKAAPRR